MGQTGDGQSCEGTAEVMEERRGGLGRGLVPAACPPGRGGPCAPVTNPRAPLLVLQSDGQGPGAWASHV